MNYIHDKLNAVEDLNDVGFRALSIHPMPQIALVILNGPWRST